MGTARTILVAVTLCAWPASVRAVNIETVTVGNPGNPGEWSGESYGGAGPDRICGAVDYTYGIGKYEVTAGQYTEFLNAVAATDTYGLYDPYMDQDRDPDNYGCNIKRAGSPGTYTYSVASDWANRAVNYASWGDAARFANWLHNGQPTGPQGLGTTEDGSYFLDGATTEEALMAVSRKPNATCVIPSEDEWYKAAYHKNDGVTWNYWDYPTGNDEVPSNELVDPDPGNNANYRETIGGPYYRTEAGEFENSESSYGTYDQGGNVWEWTEEVVPDVFRGLRGGGYADGAYNLHASYRGYYSPPTTGYCGDFGFRVAFVPEPAALGILVLGLIALRRQRPGNHRRT